MRGNERKHSLLGLKTCLHDADFSPSPSKWIIHAAGIFLVQNIFLLQACFGRIFILIWQPTAECNAIALTKKKYNFWYMVITNIYGQDINLHLLLSLTNRVKRKPPFVYSFSTRNLNWFIHILKLTPHKMTKWIHSYCK